MKLSRYCAEVPNEPSVKISKPLVLYILMGNGYRPVKNSLNRILIHFNLAFRNNITQN